MTMKNSHAVSPVVGVMLMLVVTILIAAVVSAFAGGLAQNQGKTPQSQISGTYSQSRGMTISNDGGDVLSAYDIQVYVSTTNSWGAGSEYKTYAINKSVMMTNGIIWSPTDSQYLKVKKFGPGDMITISAQNLSFVQQNLYDPGIETAKSALFTNPDNVGNTIVVKLYDMKSSKIITQSAPIVIQS